MSRTWHHGDKAKERRFGKRFRTFWYDHDRVVPPKQKRHKQEWHWLRNEPSWWIHDFMTVPQRAEVRQLLHKVMKMKDLEDPPLFPLSKKPHNYYW